MCCELESMVLSDAHIGLAETHTLTDKLPTIHTDLEAWEALRNELNFPSFL